VKVNSSYSWEKRDNEEREDARLWDHVDGVRDRVVGHACHVERDEEARDHVVARDNCCALDEQVVCLFLLVFLNLLLGALRTH